MNSAPDSQPLDSGLARMLDQVEYLRSVADAEAAVGSTQEADSLLLFSAHSTNLEEPNRLSDPSAPQYPSPLPTPPLLPSDSPIFGWTFPSKSPPSLDWRPVPEPLPYRAISGSDVCPSSLAEPVPQPLPLRAISGPDVLPSSPSEPASQPSPYWAFPGPNGFPPSPLEPARPLMPSLPPPAILPATATIAESPRTPPDTPPPTISPPSTPPPITPAPTTAAPFVRRSKKVVVQERVVCASHTCMVPIGFFHLLGTQEAINTPHLTSVMCTACDLAEALAVASTSAEPRDDLISSSRTARKKRRLPGAALGPVPICCNACGNLLGVGGIRLVPDEARQKEWIEPDFTFQLVCDSCNDLYRWCTEVRPCRVVKAFLWWVRGRGYSGCC
ncbi:hypothetical protein BDK51DRAFT_51206 [Blyttiomyces helicus]|uniref:Uncharacterized protein n=1 Tax=Blyttiomyces helicus TaxID=388810 RepID=A0A4P9VX67_9FUNG|nr:hypothetical protein BDK51DRAFT_51206 [Blyttiomyces helicus]|eukprot:RKO83293.1 hypothetical protein BDK51DRAFT_51206 [Blyttiomyces helicus]